MPAALTLGINKVTDDAGIQTMKSTLLDVIKTRFAHLYREKLYTVATLVDPRYKARVNALQQLDTATTWLLEEIRHCPTASASAADGDDDSSAAPPDKRLRHLIVGGLRSLLDEAMSTTGGSGTADVASNQVKLFLSQPSALQLSLIHI